MLSVSKNNFSNEGRRETDGERRKKKGEKKKKTYGSFVSHSYVGDDSALSLPSS